MKSIIKLFKALPITKEGKKNPSEEILKETMKRGFIFSPEVAFNYSDKELLNLIPSIEEEIGISGEKANASFHKSWAKVRDASIEQLVLEQLVHYFTTYGFEALGIYNEDSVYIPNEKLEIPELNIDKFNFTVIKGYTKEQLKQKLVTFLQSGIALADDTKSAVIDICLFIDITSEDIERIKNKEVSAVLYDFLDKIPENPVEFLRYVIYKSTGKTLLIKNKEVIEEIKSKDNFDILQLFYKYKKQYGLKRLAEIFYRFKPIFLAFKSTTNTQLNQYINKTRKLAIRYHKPMPEDFLNNITSMIKNNKVIYSDVLVKELDRVNTFRKIRLAYALKYRTGDVDSILYKVRNGKSFATEFTFENKEKASRVLEFVIRSIVRDIKKNVEGKKIYIPDNIVYTLPATEKQFTGDFPSGSYVTIPKDMIFGIHWENVKHHRIDLDLSLNNVNLGKIGWDSSYRSYDRTVLFSGDIVDAPKPKGASELFYVARQENASYILMVNYYNYDEDVSVSFKILVAKKELESLSENYTVDPNDIICVSKTKIDKEQKSLGLIVTTPDDCKFYFNESNLGAGRTTMGKEYLENARKYLVDFYMNMISLNDILKSAGAIIVTDKEEADIDLSPESLDKEKIIKLLTKKVEK